MFNTEHRTNLSDQDIEKVTATPLTFKKEKPYAGPAVQYAVLHDGQIIGRVYGWDTARAGLYDMSVVREWHSGTATPWHLSRRAAALDVLIRHLGHSGRSPKSM